MRHPGTDFYRREADAAECKRRDKAHKRATRNAREWVRRGTRFLLAGEHDTAEANFARATAEMRQHV